MSKSFEDLKKDLKANADEQAAADQETGWDDELNWDDASNPEFDSLDQAMDHLAEEDARRELPAPRAMVQTFEPRVGEPVAEPRNTLTPLANAWMATPAPAVGICGGDLTPHLASLVGVYGSITSGRITEYAAMVDVDRQANGLFIAQAQRPGAGHQPSERFQPVPGPNADAEARAWLKTVAEGVRTQLHGGMTLAVVVTPETGWEDNQLDDVAIAGEALIILHRPDAKQEWKPRLLEPKAVPVKDAPAVPEPKVVRYQENVGPIQATPDAVWISRVPRAVVGYPTEIQGPRGEQVQCGYGMDPERYEVVKLTGWTESPGGAVEQMRLEVAPGCSVPLANFEVRLSESPVE